jgi:hypothetical protein
MEFQYSKIQAWKSWKINFSHGKSWKIEILQNINKVLYLFQFTSHNNILYELLLYNGFLQERTEFCSFIISVIVKMLTNFRNSILPGHGF